MFNPPIGHRYLYAHATHAAHAASARARLPRFTALLCAWMATGLTITGVVIHLTAALITASPTGAKAIREFPMMFALILALQFGFVLVVSTRIPYLPLRPALMCFLVYAAINGIWLVGFFVLYTPITGDVGFYITAGMFAVMAVLAFMGKVDVLKGGALMLMALIGASIATGTHLYLHGTTASLLVSYSCVVVFVLLIAYDRERLTWLSIGIGISVRRVGLLGALLLYLDLLNIIFLVLSSQRQNRG